MDRQAIGRKSRRKGKAWERHVVKLLVPVFGKAERGWWQAKGGTVVPDIVVPAPFWIECGHGDRMEGRKKLEQADRNRGPASAKMPVAITRRTGSRHIDVTVWLADLIRLAEHLPATETVRVFVECTVTMELAEWIVLVTDYLKELERHEQSPKTA